MVKIAKTLDVIADSIRKDLTAKDTARERILPLCREAIRYCSLSIRALHRQEMKEAHKMLKKARELLDEAEEALADGGETIRANIILDSQKEYAEGCITLSLVEGKQPPSPQEIGVEPVAYLHGMGDAVGELRRYLMDGLRKGDLSRGEELLGDMDDIYNILVTMDFPDAVTNGLRRITDMVRGVLEKTRSDLTLTIRQKELEDRLDKFQK
ncbi:MAG: haloacid dehalogenase [Dehalococcoidales bacterium]|nr:haloacid dehalogenase [Dehalococcoidales bacterium]